VALACVATLGFGLGVASTRAQVHPPLPSPVPAAAGERTCTPEAACCKVCDKGKACGDSCISRQYDCHKGKGCACDRSDLCAQ
jgi:hypothetical protein